MIFDGRTPLAVLVLEREAAIIECENAGAAIGFAAALVVLDKALARIEKLEQRELSLSSSLWHGERQQEAPSGGQVIRFKKKPQALRPGA